MKRSLPAADRGRLEQHLVDCPGCVNYLEQMKQTLKILGHIPEETVSPEARKKLGDAFRKWKEEA